jgi:Fe-S-cluster-containing dehydrogenase component
MSKKYGMVIDVAKCTGCYACFLACKDENAGEEHAGYTAAQPMTGQHWMNMVEVERGTFPKVKLNHIPVTCNQCDNPACLNAAQNGAVYRRDDGIVMIDPVKSVGQKQIVNSCPYRVIFWNEEKKVPQKCDMCAHLLDQGFKRPRCVEMCPTGCLTFGDLNDPNSEVSKLVAGKKPYARHPEFELGDKVLYLNVPRKFVAGTVVFKETDQCAANVTVTLKGKDVEKSYVTDEFGDFWFEELKSKENYTVEIAHAGHKPIRLDVRTYSDVNVGDLLLEKSA